MVIGEKMLNKAFFFVSCCFLLFRCSVICGDFDSLESTIEDLFELQGSYAYEVRSDAKHELKKGKCHLIDEKETSRLRKEKYDCFNTGNTEEDTSKYICRNFSDFDITLKAYRTKEICQLYRNGVQLELNNLSVIVGKYASEQPAVNVPRKPSFKNCRLLTKEDVKEISKLGYKCRRSLYDADIFFQYQCVASGNAGSFVIFRSRAYCEKFVPERTMQDKVELE